MRKLPFLTNERLSRMLVSLMLCLGLLMPLMLTFGVGGAMLSACVTAAVLCVALSLLGGLRRGRLILAALISAASLV